MKRVKKLEYEWIFKDSFKVSGYKFESEDGNTYVVWAKDMPNAKWLYATRLNTKLYNRDCEDCFSSRYLIKPWFIKGTDKMHTRPFWYYGRVYKLK